MALISVEEIGFCRSGPDNDIDLEAVYGGRISGKREKDIKVNPIYTDINGVTQHADINGNMSPVHVVTYESFPCFQSKAMPPENGKIQNESALQQTDVHLIENSQDNSGFKEDVENKTRNSGTTDVNHDTQEDAQNTRINQEKRNVSKSVHLKYMDSKLCGEYSELESDDTDDHKHTNHINHINDDHTQSENSYKQQPRGFHKDYNMLSYHNKSFVLDENDAVIKSKRSAEINPATVQCKEIQKGSEHGSVLEPENKDESVLVVEETSENLNTIQHNAQGYNFSHSAENMQQQNPSNDLPESTYHEILSVCNMQKSESFTNTGDFSQNIHSEFTDPGDSPQTFHKDIVADVLVHNSSGEDSPKIHLHSDHTNCDNMCYRFVSENNQEGQLRKNLNDWPEIESLVRSVQEETFMEIAQNDESWTETKGHIRSVSDIVIQEKETGENDESKGDKSTADGTLLQKKKQMKMKSNSKTSVVNEVGSSTRTLKSILSNNSSHPSCSVESDHKRKNSDSEIHELKTVKFSEDTVFNENKSNKYKKEKFGQINLRELYRGKIMSDAAVAKMNPLFQPDEGVIEGGEREGDGNSITANDKLTYQLTLKNALRLSKGQPASFNSPSYLEQYLILKAHGIKSDAVDIERLPETLEKPVYDRLIERTLAKERRKICVKWSMVILTVAVITAVATTLGVYFKEGF